MDWPAALHFAHDEAGSHLGLRLPWSDHARGMREKEGGRSWLPAASPLHPRSRTRAEEAAIAMRTVSIFFSPICEIPRPDRYRESASNNAKGK